MKIDPSKYDGKKQGQPPAVSGYYALVPKAFQYGEYGKDATPRLDIYVHVISVKPRSEKDGAKAEDMAGRTVRIDQWLSDDDRNQASIGHLLLACGAPPLVDENATSLAQLVSSKVAREIFAKHVAGKPLVADCYASNGKDGQGRLSIKVDAWRAAKTVEPTMAAAREGGYEPADPVWMEDEVGGGQKRGGGAARNSYHDESPPIEAYGDFPDF